MTSAARSTTHDRLLPAAALVLLVLVTAGCAGAAPASPRLDTGAPTPAPAAAPAADDVATPRTSRGDLSKETAVAFVEAVGSWDETQPTAASDRVVAAGYPAALGAVAPQLVDLPTPRARTQVVFAQQGGLTATTASVIVLAEQSWGDTGHDGVRQLVLDVRLVLLEGRWEVTASVAPPRPPLAPARAGGPTALGRAVLGDPALVLPEPVRADIVERRVGDPILGVLQRLGARARIDVQVAATGHPGTVYPTSRLSNHAVGRAFDIRAIDGVPVEELRDDRRLEAVMTAAGEAGATEVGGPIRVDGTGFFTDAVHRDHVHVGITPGKPAARAVPR